jgi:hypothetical protein
MSRELDLLANEYAKEPATVLRKDIKLYWKTLGTELSPFIREVERTAKRDKSGEVTVIAILSEWTYDEDRKSVV